MSTVAKLTKQIQVAIAWCLTYSSDDPNPDRTLQALRSHFYDEQPCEGVLADIVAAVRSLSSLKHPETRAELQQYITHYPALWQNKIGIVYGGATKIKPYVFDMPKLHEIRGASALLDNINLVDLPAFFHADESEEQRFKACWDANTEQDRQIKAEYCQSVRRWLSEEGYEALERSLIHELIIYSTGGNILAFCPQNLVASLANAIEKRYTTETLVANSCAVGKAYKPLELQFGLLPDHLSDDFFWLEHYQKNAQDTLVQAYLKIEADATPEDIETAFRNRKSFNEITSQLAILFNQRRAGNDVGEGDRSSRRYPVMVETHPYLRRDSAEKRPAVLQAKDLPNSPWYSEASARKRIIGQIAKRKQKPEFQGWYDSLKSRWEPNQRAESWVKRFEDYLSKHSIFSYYRNVEPKEVSEAQTVAEIGNASSPRKYIAYIYADANNMGGYIQGITAPEDYRRFSEDISRITEESVYEALSQHLAVHKLQGLTDPDSYHENGEWIHPFEIITIGGDDVFLIVPASQALQIAHTIGSIFEQKLLGLEHGEQYQIKLEQSSNHFRPAHLIHRYQPNAARSGNSKLSMSIGMLITSEDMPITYAQNLTEQLLKSAKEKAKTLKQPCNYNGVEYQHGYYGGTIDFLVLKSVTMISSNIREFRRNGLVKTFGNKKTRTGEKPKDLHLYATPYTLHEIGGLIALIQALKAVDFPKSQLYQIRSFLDRGKRTAILNYRYFRTRLDRKPSKDQQQPLIELFENSWCAAKENNGNIAPWMYYTELPDSNKPSKEKPKAYYETIWRELVDLYEFIPEVSIPDADESAAMRQPAEAEQ